MSTSKLRPHAPFGALVLVCDGRKALLFKNGGSPAAPRLELLEKTDAPPNPPTREQGTDQPGRVASSAGRGSAVGQTDWHDEAERDFARATVRQLEKAAQATSAAHLVVVAPPRTLAVLRDHWPASLKAILAGEHALDLTRHPVPDIEAWLASREAS